MLSLWGATSALAGIAVAAVAVAKVRQRRVSGRHEVRRISRELLPLVEAVAVRHGGDQVENLKRSRPEWASLRKAGIQAGGSFARQSKTAARLLESWEEDYELTGTVSPRPDAGTAAESHVRSAARVLWELAEELEG